MATEGEGRTQRTDEFRWGLTLHEERLRTSTRWSIEAHGEQVGPKITSPVGTSRAEAARTIIREIVGGSDG